MGPHVVLDVTLEGFVADLTLVHLLPLVERQNVPLERISPRICLVTEMTLKLFVVLMKLGMGLEISAAGEGCVTLVTFVRLLPAVNPLMHNELTSPGERLATLLTLVRLFSSVSSGMETQPLFDGESLPALPALVGHLAGVAAHVDGQGAHLHELLAAHAALVGLVPGVLPRVLLHICKY